MRWAVEAIPTWLRMQLLASPERRRLGDRGRPRAEGRRLAGHREEGPQQRAAERLRRLRVRGLLDLDVGAVVGQLEREVHGQRLERDVRAAGGGCVEDLD